MVLDPQRRVVINLAAVRGFVRRLQSVLSLARRDFNVCFVSDQEIGRMNAAFRGKSQPTDVLSFPWQDVGAVREPPLRSPRAVRKTVWPYENREGKIKAGKSNAGIRASSFEFRVSNFDPSAGQFAGFLGDVVISLETARRNARAEGHSIQNEVRGLILHGLLHLLGYDHETDNGEMTALELSLRDELGI